MNETGAPPPAERRVTPESLRTMTFPRAPLTRRGYSEQPVHDALRRCAAALTALTEENDRLRADMQRHRDWIRANNIGDGKSPTGVPTVDAVLQQARAQQSAEQTVFAAREQARTMLRAARTQAEAILQELREHGNQIGDETQEETERLISYLRQIAESLTVTANQYATRNPNTPPPYAQEQGQPQAQAYAQEQGQPQAQAYAQEQAQAQPRAQAQPQPQGQPQAHAPSQDRLPAQFASQEQVQDHAADPASAPASAPASGHGA